MYHSNLVLSWPFEDTSAAPLVCLRGKERHERDRTEEEI